MAIIELEDPFKSLLVDQIRRYLQDEHDVEFGQFDAEFLLDFFAEKCGVHFYNQGVRDAQVVLAERIDSIADALMEIEKPTS